MFENFWGSVHGRLAQTLLFSGPEGVGKAAQARRLGARLLGCRTDIDAIERAVWSIVEPYV